MSRPKKQPAKAPVPAGHAGRTWLPLGIALALVIALGVQLAFLSGFLPPEPAPARTGSPLSLEGFERVEVAVTPSVIYLTAGCRQLAMASTDSQTYSIRLGLEKQVDARPTIHDVMKDLVENLGITVRMAKIEDLQDSTYYARLLVQQGERLLGLDSKPSDAVAVAVRFDAPVYVKAGILEAHGKSVC